MFPLCKVGCRGHWGRTSESVMWFSPQRFVEALVCRESGLVLPSSVCSCSQHSFQKYTFVPWQSSGCEMKLLSCVWLCDSVDSSLPGSSIHGIFQARVLEWVAISFSKWVWQSRKNKTWVLSLALPPVASRILFKCLLHFVIHFAHLQKYVFKIHLLWTHLEKSYAICKRTIILLCG